MTVSPLSRPPQDRWGGRDRDEDNTTREWIIITSNNTVASNQATFGTFIQIPASTLHVVRLMQDSWGGRDREENIITKVFTKRNITKTVVRNGLLHRGVVPPHLM